VAAAPVAAVRATDRGDWWSARPARTLVVQGLQDVIAAPENGRRYVELIASAGPADHAELVELDGAGHALLPERPTEVARALIDFLDRASRTTPNGPTGPIRP
jgi:pimeloyl-ACP methyl ester carboxylesterase